MEYTALSYNRGNKHRGEHGNLVGDPIRVDVEAGNVAGDVIKIDDCPWDHMYTSLIVSREALTAGLTVMVGIQQTLDGDFTDPDFFGAALNMDAAGADQLITVPKIVVDASGRKITHDLIVTLGGTVTADESFWVTATRLFLGAP